MKAIRFKSTINVSWNLIGEDGQNIDLHPYNVQIFVITGNGRTRADGVTVSGDNYVYWTFRPEEQLFQGVYHLQLTLLDENGRIVYSYMKRDLFRLSDAMYDYYGIVPLKIIGYADEGVMPSPEQPGLIQKTYTEDDFGGSFDKSIRTDTFNAHAINRLHERLSDTEEMLSILQLARYTIYLWAENGAMLMRYGAETDIRAEVWRDQEDITDLIPGSLFCWKRSSGNAEQDAAWNRAHEGVGKTIHVTRADVNTACTFYVEIPVETLNRIVPVVETETAN